MLAYQARLEWTQTHAHSRTSTDSPSARAARAMRLASQAQYGRAMRTIINPPIADLNDPTAIQKIQALHLSRRVPVLPLPPSAHPRPPEITEQQVLQAVRR